MSLNGIFSYNSFQKQKYKQTGMLFQDEYAIERALETDLDAFIRLIKSEEEDYLCINEILIKFFHNRSEIQNNIFVHDQISKYRQIGQQKHRKITQLAQSKRCILQKYGNVATINDSTLVLLKRVIFRVLEIVFSSINQLSPKPTNSYQDYIRFKLLCQRLLSDGTEKPLQILKCISDYTGGKLSKSLITLTLIANNLQNGNMEEVDKLKINSLASKVQDIECIKENKSSILEMTSKVRAKQKEKAIAVREQARASDKEKLILQRKARKNLDNIKDVLQINKQDYLQDCVNICMRSIKEISGEVLKEMLQRNKVNNKQISQFLHKKSHLHKRKLSRLLQTKQFKQTASEVSKIDLIKTNNSKQISAYESSNSVCHTTRRSLLLKFKESEYRERTITSQFYRKITKAEQHRNRLRSSQKSSGVDIKNSDLKQAKAMFQTIQEIISQNDELALRAKVQNSGDAKEKLPLLNKRAYSVDQNYKTQQPEHLEANSKAFTHSTKLQQTNKKRIKVEKVEKTQMLPSKIKIQLKTTNNFLNCDFSKKLTRFGEFHRHVCL